MAEVDKYSFFKPKNHPLTAEDQLINILILLDSDRSWEKYTKEERKVSDGLDAITFRYEE